MARKPRSERARLRVNPIACDGRGLCAELLPELITIDDWGFPIIGDNAVPAHLMGDARTTIRACPKLALRLERSLPLPMPGRPLAAYQPAERRRSGADPADRPGPGGQDG